MLVNNLEELNQKLLPNTNILTKTLNQTSSTKFSLSYGVKTKVVNLFLEYSMIKIRSPSILTTLR